MPKKILIVDDSQVFRDLEQVLLGRHGFRLVTAGDGAEAVRKAVSETPDLILLDLQMPVMTGRQALAILKGNPQTHDIPVVVVTTTAGARERQTLVEAGAASVLHKPIDSVHLLATVGQLLG
jgi:CheY-like chemotaxis protein